MKILVLCHGNINRSPLCAAVLSAQGHEATSAGFVNPGQKATRKIRECAQKLWGLDLSAHRSQLVTLGMCNDAEAIVCMTPTHAEKLTEQVFFEGPVPIMLGDYCTPRLKSIPDPNYINPKDPEFERVAWLIVDASHRLGLFLHGAQ